MSKIARRKFIQLSAVAAAGCFVRPGSDAQAQDLPRITADDPVGQALQYTHDASTVDPASRPQPAVVTSGIVILAALGEHQAIYLISPATRE